MTNDALKQALETIPLNISSSRRSGTNGLRNADEVIATLQPFLASQITPEEIGQFLAGNSGDERLCFRISRQLQRQLAERDAEIERLKGNSPRLVEACQPNGGLRLRQNGYLHFNWGDKHVTIDGEFTAKDLRAIATHVERNRKPKP